MKKRILFLAIAFAGISTAQPIQNLGDFRSLKVFDQITVNLIPSDENKVELKGKRSGDVEVVNKNGQLKIRMRASRLLDGENVTADLYFRTLTDIDASEGALITTSATLSQPKIVVTAKEGAQIELNIEVQNADVKSVTGGIVRLAGSAENLKASLGTGGELRAKPLVTEQTDIKINAGGEAEINASELVDANIKAGGNIKVYGNPRQVNKKTTFGGDITVMK